MRTPERIQRRRIKGWRMPPLATYVGRPSKWGNPWMVVVDGWDWDVRHESEDAFAGTFAWHNRGGAQRAAVNMFRLHMDEHPELREAARRELAGRDLACWCKTTDPCHADVLLEISNG